MRGDVKRYVLSCAVCQFSKPVNRKPGGFMQPVVASFPWEFVGVDFVGPLPKSNRGNEFILVFVDYFTKWVEICPVREATARVAADKFLSEVFARHGAPKYLVSDRGVQFVSDLFEAVVATIGTAHRLTTAYHPQSNQTERVNRTIKTAIRAYVGLKHREWDRHLPLISFALRTAPHQSTGESPASLIYGRELETPLDLWMRPNREPGLETVEAYRSELSETLQEAYNLVRQSLAVSHEKQKFHYDKKRRHVTFSCGDLVRLKTHPRSDASSGFTAKLAPVYKGPYRVVKVMSDLNYRLSKVCDGSDVGVHHVSNLMPFVTWGEDTDISLQKVTEPNLGELGGSATDEKESYALTYLWG
uniref:Integrase catalytic domain-containing protein n=1 Tax=Paramormyrops kingsleyae TaxID=1676925 RepID=A0A3B3QYN6_9TELE